MSQNYLSIAFRMLCLSFVVILSMGSQTAFSATSVTSYGITWYFSQDRPVGQFANGDWWVVGPVTLTQITPEDPTPGDSGDIHGTMINPLFKTNGTPNWLAVQGFDSRVRDTTYSASLNVAKRLPFTVPAGSSVMSCKSLIPAASGDAAQMDEISILTVVASAPPAGTFRPPYVGAHKPLNWNKSQLLYSRLKKLPPVTATPTFAATEAFFERTLIQLNPNWTSRYIHPLKHDSPNYGREISHKLGAGMLLLNLNYSDAQKETLLIRMVQRGIDIYGITNSGGGFFADGGHNHGRKGFMILAGWMLNDNLILSRANASFAEDGQHFYVTQADVDRVRPEGREPYTVQMIGTPEWGFQHAGDPSLDSSKWGATYRGLVGVSNMGPVLAARIMGIENQWNYQAIFDYMDRFYSIEQGNVATTTNSIQPFVSNMWKAYRGTGSGITPPPPPPPPVLFAINSRIATVRNTNVRANGTLSGTLLGVQVTGSLGVIVGGPIVADGFTWWQINYDSGADGWSGQDNLAISTAGLPGPTPPLPPTGVQVTGMD